MLLASPIVALSPALMALVMTPFCPGGFSGANEGNCAAAALPWLLIATIPLGILLAIAGFIAIIVRAASNSRRPPTENTDNTTNQTN